MSKTDATREVVYVPCEPVQDGGRRVNVQMRHLRDGTLALFTYTSLERLASACGPGQGWAAFPADQVEWMRDQFGADEVVWDVLIPLELRVDEEGKA